MPYLGILTDLPPQTNVHEKIEEPLKKHNQNQIIYINPMPVVTEMVDPILPGASPVKDAPQG